jgi:hypothetical protein
MLNKHISSYSRAKRVHTYILPEKIECQNERAREQAAHPGLRACWAKFSSCTEGDPAGDDWLPVIRDPWAKDNTLRKLALEVELATRNRDLMSEQ